MFSIKQTAYPSTLELLESDQEGVSKIEVECIHH